MEVERRPAGAPRGRGATLSVVVITLNEEENLPWALESVRWADEIVVVDSGSTDGTERVARRYTDRFVAAPWVGQGPQKERGRRLARGEWVLFLDADEEVSPELRRSIEGALRDPGDRVGFEVLRHDFYLGHWFGRRGWRRDWTLRLFRRERGRFTDAVIHERAVVDGAVGRLRGPLLHYTYRDIHHHVEKINFYTTHLARARYREGKRCGAATPLLRGLGRFLAAYVVRGGFLDGRPGLVGAALAGVYAFLKYAKLWELGRTEGQPGRSPPGEEAR